MKLLCFAIVFSICQLVEISKAEVDKVGSASSKMVEAAFQSGSLVPDVVKSAPKELLQVVFPTGDTVSPGIKLIPRNVKERPDVNWTANPSDLYTIVMIDLDAPSRKDNSMSPILHWLEINVPGNNSRGGHVSQAYSGPKPPANSGLHRYVQLVYKQSGLLDPSDTLLLKPVRRSYPFKSLVEKFNFGDPVAGNYYVASFDPSVINPTVNATTVSSQVPGSGR